MMKPAQTFPRLLLPALAMLVIAAPAHAEGPGTIEMAQTYHDLPGVRPPEERVGPPPLTCDTESAFTRRPSGRAFDGYPDVYVCSRGGVTYNSGVAPPNVYRSLRGMGW